MRNIAIVLTVMFLLTIVHTKNVDSSAIIYIGIGSWYSEQDHGILETTANMEHFDDTKFTCAIWDIPFDTILKVTNLKDRKSVLVRVNDRGPAKRFRQQGRIIDLTKTAFSRIADLKEGLIWVTVEII